MTHPTEPLLGRALELLAGDVDAQEEHLRQLGTWPSLDELALELDDAGSASEGWASPELDQCLRLLDRKLDEMSGQEHARLWTADALYGPEWAEVRRCRQ